MIEANAANYAEGKKALFVTGLASEKQMEQVCRHLKVALPQTQIVCEEIWWKVHLHAENWLRQKV